MTASAPATNIFGIPIPAQDNSSTDSAPQPAPSTGSSGDGIGDQTSNFLNDIIANANENTCLMLRNHEYEVCTAYIFNAVFADLVPYYNFAHSSNSAMAHFVSYRLDSRYGDQANTLIRNRVAAWPAGETNVDVPIIKILSVNADLTTNTATLQTQESWLVTDQHQNVLYQADGGYHFITMQRVPSYVLHKWVVTDIE